MDRYFAYATLVLLAYLAMALVSTFYAAVSSALFHTLPAF